MSLKDNLENDLKEALRSGDEVRKRTIRMIIASIKLARVEKGSDIEDPEIVSIIQKEIKNRKDASVEAHTINRHDLVKENEAEILVLEGYLPKQLSEAEIYSLIQMTVKEIGASGIGDMGKVMKVLIPKIQGRAPGDVVSSIVRKMLQG